MRRYIREAAITIMMVGLGFAFCYALTVTSAPFSKVVPFALGPGEKLSITWTHKVKTTTRVDTLFSYTASTTAGSGLEGYAALHGTEK